MPPMVGKIKDNFYGASSSNPGPVGYGCVLRDSQDIIIIVKSGPIGFNNAYAELMGLL